MSGKYFSSVLFLLLAATFSACGDDGSEGTAGQGGTSGDCEDVPTYADVSAFDKCTMCHSSSLSGPDRNNAPMDHNFDTYDGAADHADHIAEEAEGNNMPPPASGITITAAEREALIKWATCGTPED